jgi:hypothetical protein
VAGSDESTAAESFASPSEIEIAPIVPPASASVHVARVPLSWTHPAPAVRPALSMTTKELDDPATEIRFAVPAAAVTTIVPPETATVESAARAVGAASTSSTSVSALVATSVRRRAAGFRQSLMDDLLLGADRLPPA